MLNPTVHANCKFLYCAKILKPLIVANDIPTITAILISVAFLVGNHDSLCLEMASQLTKLECPSWRSGNESD